MKIQLWQGFGRIIKYKAQVRAEDGQIIQGGKAKMIQGGETNMTIMVKMVKIIQKMTEEAPDTPVVMGEISLKAPLAMMMMMMMMETPGA